MVRFPVFSILTATKETAGSLFDHLFETVVTYKPRKGFNSRAASCQPKQAQVITEVIEIRDGTPRVSFSRRTEMSAPRLPRPPSLYCDHPRSRRDRRHYRRRHLVGRPRRAPPRTRTAVESGHGARRAAWLESLESLDTMPPAAPAPPARKQRYVQPTKNPPSRATDSPMTTARPSPNSSKRPFRPRLRR